MNHDVEHIIRSYNRTWHQLYYEELVERESYQLSLLSCAGSGFYNCAHLFTPLNEKLLAEVEAYFALRAIQPSLYIESNMAAKLEGVLGAAGYEELDEERESWWSINKEQMHVISSPRNTTIKKINIDSDDLNIFLKIDAGTNSLSTEIIEKMRLHIRNRRELKSAYFLGYDNSPVACGMITEADKVAYLAEGGVLEPYRQRGFHKAITLCRLNFAFDEWDIQSAIMVTARDNNSRYTAESMKFHKIFERRFFTKKADFVTKP